MTAPLRCHCAAAAAFSRMELAPGLGAWRCDACGGSLLELEDHARWHAAQAAALAPPAEVPLASEEVDTGTHFCPLCTRLMSRYRVGTAPDFRVDRCAPCQRVWFDRGEWEALVKAGLAGQLGAILSEAWQRKLQAEERRAAREAALRLKHGDACMDELTRLRDWLDAQPQRDELLNLLRAGW